MKHRTTLAMRSVAVLLLMVTAALGRGPQRDFASIDDAVGGTGWPQPDQTIRARW